MKEMKSKLLRYFAFLLLTLFTLASCRHEEDNSGKEETNKLYEGTLQLIRTYNDSLSYASDTLSVSTLFHNFNKSLEKLNFDVRPDTDLTLTEGQNDTLYMKICELRNLYDQKMKEAARTPVEEEEAEANDSLTTDEP